MRLCTWKFSLWLLDWHSFYSSMLNKKRRALKGIWLAIHSVFEKSYWNRCHRDTKRDFYTIQKWRTRVWDENWQDIKKAPKYHMYEMCFRKWSQKRAFIYKNRVDALKMYEMSSMAKRDDMQGVENFLFAWVLKFYFKVLDPWNCLEIFLTPNFRFCRMVFVCAIQKKWYLLSK